jgi:excisionase family DNA binding protein
MSEGENDQAEGKPEGEAVSPSMAAELTGVDRLTILKWIRKGVLPAETVRHRNGNGYAVRIEDVLAAKNRPRAKASAPRQPVAGSVVAELHAMRAEIQELRESQAKELEASRAEVAASRAEVRDLRGQLAQTEARLHDAIQKALPARVEPAPPEKPRGWFARWWHEH